MKGSFLTHKVVMVLLPDTVAHPGAVVVEAGHAPVHPPDHKDHHGAHLPVTDAAVLTPDGPLDQAGAAEDAGVEALVLCQLYDGPVLDLLAGPHYAGV